MGIIGGGPQNNKVTKQETLIQKDEPIEDEEVANESAEEIQFNMGGMQQQVDEDAINGAAGVDDDFQ